MIRQTLPSRRPSFTVAIKWQGHDLAVTVGMYPDTGAPGEVFCDTGRSGSLQATLDDTSVIISITLQCGITPTDLAKSLSREPAWVNGAETVAPASPVGAIMAVILECGVWA